jgi:hypothetical protein
MMGTAATRSAVVELLSRVSACDMKNHGTPNSQTV